MRVRICDAPRNAFSRICASPLKLSLSPWVANCEAFASKSRPTACPAARQLTELASRVAGIRSAPGTPAADIRGNNPKLNSASNIVIVGIGSVPSSPRLHVCVSIATIVGACERAIIGAFADRTREVGLVHARQSALRGFRNIGIRDLAGSARDNVFGSCQRFTAPCKRAVAETSAFIARAPNFWFRE